MKCHKLIIDKRIIYIENSEGKRFILISEIDYRYIDFAFTYRIDAGRNIQTLELSIQEKDFVKIIKESERLSDFFNCIILNTSTSFQCRSIYEITLQFLKPGVNFIIKD